VARGHLADDEEAETHHEQQPDAGSGREADSCGQAVHAHQPGREPEHHRGNGEDPDVNGKGDAVSARQFVQRQGVGYPGPWPGRNTGAQPVQPSGCNGGHQHDRRRHHDDPDEKGGSLTQVFIHGSDAPTP
jgi:hypothetical protein